MQSGFQCSYCGEWNETEVDESAASLQLYVEDCQTCCQPNVLVVRYDREQGQFSLQASREN